MLHTFYIKCQTLWMTSDDRNQKLKERMKNRTAYLTAFYDIYADTGETWVNRPTIVEKSGLSVEDARQAEDYWLAQKFIKIQTMGPNGLIELLHDGSDAVEASLMTPIQEKADEISGNLCDIFISHSSKDVPTVQALIYILRSALNVEGKRILCTSVDGHRIGIGKRTEDELREAVNNSTVFIGLITEHSLASTYVLFELGARWATKRRMFAMAGNDTQIQFLKEPLKHYNCGSCSNRSNVHQLIREVGEELGKTPESADVYESFLEILIQQSQAEIQKSQTMGEFFFK